MRPDGDGNHKKTHRERIELDATVEAIGDRHHTARGAFCEIKGMTSATKAGLEIAPFRVDPKEFWHIFRFAAADYDSLVLATSLGRRRNKPGHQKALRNLESACF